MVLKRLKAIDDGNLIFRIDAARISFELVCDAHIEIGSLLNSFSDRKISYQDSIKLMKNIWQFVDYCHRYSEVIKGVRGLKHKDQRFQDFQFAVRLVIRARNFIQHLTTEIPKTGNMTYPIFGAISWGSNQGSQSNTLSLGTLPKGTNFYTLSFNKDLQSYENGIFLNISDVKLEINGIFEKIQQMNIYLNEWLVSKELITEEDMAPTVMIAGSLSDLSAKLDFKFLRIQYCSHGEL